MRFEVFAKYGNRWSCKGTWEARDSRQAAFLAQYSTGRNVLGVRPEGSDVKLFVYRITSAPQVTS